jgi:hypothetical protein
MNKAQEILNLLESTEPESKDIMRLTDIKKKSNGNKDKARQLAGNMSLAITDKDKAVRRAKAALQVYSDDPKFAQELYSIFTKVSTKEH